MGWSVLSAHYSLSYATVSPVRRPVIAARIAASDRPWISAASSLRCLQSRRPHQRTEAIVHRIQSNNLGPQITRRVDLTAVSHVLPQQRNRHLSSSCPARISFHRGMWKNIPGILLARFRAAVGCSPPISGACAVDALKPISRPSKNRGLATVMSFGVTVPARYHW